MKRELTHGSLFSGVEGFGLGAGISVFLEKAQELRETDPITSLSKIVLYLESEGSNTSYMDFPKSGMMHSGSAYKVTSLGCDNVGNEYNIIYIYIYNIYIYVYIILLPTPTVGSKRGCTRNRFFGSPTYRGNLVEYIRDGETNEKVNSSPTLIGKLHRNTERGGQHTT